MSRITESGHLYNASLKNGVKFKKNQLNGSKTKCPAKCLKCGFDTLPNGEPWCPLPCTVLKGSQCPRCAGILKLDTTMYQKKLKSLRKTFIVVGKYVNSSTLLDHKCLKCDTIWKSSPKSIIHQNTGCPKCAGTLRWTRESYQEKIKSKQIKLIGNFINTRKKTFHLCLTCSNKWETKPANVLIGKGCPICSLKKQTISRTIPRAVYVDIIKKMSPNVILIGDYERGRTKCLHKCLKCLHEWDVIPSAIARGRGCPKCKESKLEQKVASILENLKISFKRQFSFETCRHKKKLRFDFYIPKKNIAIECQGEQHYRPWAFSKNISKEDELKQFKLIKKRDMIKVKFCKKNKVKLLLIKYNLKVPQIERLVKIKTCKI